MGKCKLYIRSGKNDFYYGTFQNREKAEAHFNLIRAKLENEYGPRPEPIYVEQGKGKGK